MKHGQREPIAGLPAFEHAARARQGWNLAAAACGIALAALLEVFVIARYEPRAHADAEASPGRGAAAAPPARVEADAPPSDFDVRQRVLSDELPPAPGVHGAPDLRP